MELMSQISLSLSAVAFFVGILVGATGMGGGALMTPALIALGIPPATAVANDLVAAAFTKSVAAMTHWRSGRAHLRIALLLSAGSAPCAALGGWIAWRSPILHANDSILRGLIGIALLLAAAAYALRARVIGRCRKTEADTILARPIPTLLVGAAVGILVGVSSVGSGSLMLLALALLYPTMKLDHLVGTDIVQAIPLVISAALTHFATGEVSVTLLIPLIIAGSTGTFLGSFALRHIDPRTLLILVVTILTVTGLDMFAAPKPLIFVAALVSGISAARMQQRTITTPLTDADS